MADSAQLSSLSIVTQTYNEAPIIEGILRDLIEVGERVTHKLELVVVTYAGSTDGTSRIVQDMASRDERIRSVVQPAETAGYGRAFRLGIYSARNDYIFQTDADGQFDFNDLLRAARYIPEYDYVHFDRHDRQDSLERKVIGRCFYYLIRASVPSSPPLDFDAAFKLFDRRILDRFQLNCASGVLVPEFVIKAHMVGSRIYHGRTKHRARAAGEGAWEVRNKWMPIVLPNTRIVMENLRDLRVLRQEIYAFRRSLRRAAAARRAVTVD